MGIMNNEPIRWLHKATKVIFEHRLLSANPNDLIPLYTHPAKTLTDKDISDVIRDEFQHKFNGYEICFLYAFARAILRKAQEK